MLVAPVETPAENASDLIISLSGYDGPLDLMLTLAREQKLDLAQISILQLAEQYLEYINGAKKLRLEIAADYLVMAAWLAYLKSKLLLPAEQTEESPAIDMADNLRFQLMRLEAMQKAAQALYDLPQLGSDIFLRGKAEGLEVVEKPIYWLGLTDLLAAIAAPQRRKPKIDYKLPFDQLTTIESALQRLRNIVGSSRQWLTLNDFLPDMIEEPLQKKSALASTFAATLEMVKLGELELRQDETFGPIYLRRGEPDSSAA